METSPQNVPPRTETADRTGAALVVAVDGLGRLNLRAPHAASGALKAVHDQIAKRLLESSPKEARLYRLSNLRLGIYLPGMTKADATTLADELVAEARAASVFGLRFPLSIGVAASPDDSRGVDGLLASATVAATRSSERGGDRVLEFHVGMLGDADPEGPTTMESALTAGTSIALDRVLDVRDGTVVGATARTLLPASEPKYERGPFDGAARMSRLLELGRLLRRTAAERHLETYGNEGFLVVPIHPCELLVPGIFEDEPSLRAVMPNLVLRLLGGGDGSDVGLLADASDGLRLRGVRFALDSVDTRADALPLLTSVRPEFITLALAPWRSEAEEPRSSRAIERYVALADRLGISAMVTRVAAPAMRDRLRSLGVRFVTAPEAALTNARSFE